MTPTSTEQPPVEVVTFRDAQWHTRWILVGLAILLLWRCSALLDRDWLARLPAWLLLILSGVVPQVFLLLFPLLTRNSRGRTKLRIPPPKRWLIEFAITIPVTILMIVLLTGINYLVGRLSPGTSLTPESVKNLAEARETTFVYLMLLFSFTFAPLAEEVFFRGFLHNAFRARIPAIVAVNAQCLIFGFAHFYGTLHAVVVTFIGLMLTLLYEWRKTLIAPILAHAGLNLFAAIGVAVMMATLANSAALGVVGDPQDSVCVVRLIAPGSPAEKAQLRVGDVIMSVNGQRVPDFRNLVETIRSYRPGDTVTIAVERAGMFLEVEAVLQARGQMSGR